jgi:hypothetical protein
VTGSAKVTIAPTSTSGPCTSRRQRFTLRHDPGRVFSGITSQGYGVVIELTGTRSVVHHFHIGWHARCDLGNVPLYGDFLHTWPVLDGVLDHDFRDSVDIGKGETMLWTESLHGRISHRRAAGTLQASVTWTDAAGAQENRCVSRTIRWSALS